MKNNWPTKTSDLEIAKEILEEYIVENDAEALGFFEVTVNQKENKIGVRLSSWILNLTKQFRERYGETQGDEITKKVLSCCLIKGETIH